MGDSLNRGEISQSTQLPTKQFITRDEFLELWEIRGLRFRIAEFHHYCIGRGLLPHFRVDSFSKKLFRVMEQFLVEGETRRDPRFEPKTKPVKWM